ncbi:MAG TPA: aminopeptidase, partial [bacterium]|nr:aminopeptidase [bacterium]
MERKNGWEIWDESKIKEVFAYCEDYKEFLSINKTVRKFVKSCIEKSKEKGFKNIDELNVIKKGDKFYKIN